MIRLGPLLILAGVLALIWGNFGVAAVWAVAAVATIALIVLIFAMRRQGDFRGPGILIDDARDNLAKFNRSSPLEHYDVIVEPRDVTPREHEEEEGK